MTIAPWLGGVNGNVEMRLVRILQVLSLWLFWPGVALIAWGELTPNPPQLGGVFGWDKLDHFTAYFGLAAMATMVVGLRPAWPGRSWA